MSINRINSVKIQFRRSDPQPSTYDLFVFITETLKVPTDGICGVQVDAQSKCVIFKLSLEQRFHKILQSEDTDLQFSYVDGSAVPVRISDAGTTRKVVTISGLPFELPDELFTTFLASFGTVRSVKRDMWQDKYFGQIENGNRTVLMEIKNPIPSRVTIEGAVAYVTYSGQQKTCHYCQAPGHMVAECPKRQRKTNLQVNPERRSYSAAAAASSLPILLHEEPVGINLTKLTPGTSTLDTPVNRSSHSTEEVANRPEETNNTVSNTNMQSPKTTELIDPIEDEDMLEDQIVSKKRLCEDENPRPTQKDKNKKL